MNSAITDPAIYPVTGINGGLRAVQVGGNNTIL